MRLTKEVTMEKGIILKNINLTGISKIEQMRKTKEELKELVDALIEDEFYSSVDDKDKKELKDHIKEEFWDLVQSHLGLLEKHGIKAKEVMKAYPKHLEKLKSRPRKKECKKCIIKSDCKLYLTEHWTGEKEAESCRTYKEE
jgi:NTP pyrophosphatase (non-canonical NTP hydrolase)